MSMIRNIQISFPPTEGEPAQKTRIIPRGSYSVNVLANEEWIIIGKYRDNTLCALELKRVPQAERKE